MEDTSGLGALFIQDGSDPSDATVDVVIVVVVVLSSGVLLGKTKNSGVSVGRFDVIGQQAAVEVGRVQDSEAKVLSDNSRLITLMRNGDEAARKEQP